MHANPVPESVSNQKLADDFVKYFIEKILKICKDLDQVDRFNVNCEETTFVLNDFRTLSEEDVRKTIFKLQTKSCELDLIPTHIVKNHLDHFIKAMSHIVNLSLKNGIFDQDWKGAILQPLIKKGESGTV